MTRPTIARIARGEDVRAWRQTYARMHRQRRRRERLLFVGGLLLAVLIGFALIGVTATWLLEQPNVTARAELFARAQ